MTDYIDPHFIKALCCEPDKRTLQELQIIYYGLHGLEPLSSYRDSILRGLCKLVRYEKHQVNNVLYYTGELSKCWYILLSGAVFIAGSMFLPGSSFGKRNAGSFRRSCECFVLETSEMIVIDYPELNTINQLNYNTNNHNHHLKNKKIIQQQIQQQQQQQKHQQQISGLLLSSSSSTSSTSSSSSSISSSTSSINKNNNNNNNNNNNINHKLQQLQQQHQQQQQQQQQVLQQNFVGHLLNMEHHQIRHASGVNIVFDDNNFPGSSRPELYQKCNRGSHSSDTSSAYSGSDTMTSVHSSSLDADEVDLSGLVESVVDSDEEDLAESMDSLNVRDTVRECLEKDPSDRTEDDIETLLEFTQKLKAFTNMTLAVRRALCSVMVFAVVEKSGTMVMNDGEELDSWSVLINGHVDIEYNTGEKDELQVGDSFGILPTMDKLYHRGIMKTKCDDCQFVCITQTDYYSIQHQGEENTKRHEENGLLVMITEMRHGLTEIGRRGHVVIRGTPERLMLQLIEENSQTDPYYVQDFLLTHRTFIKNPKIVVEQLMEWFNDCSPSIQLITNTTQNDIRDRVTYVIHHWIDNHFTDFETDPKMMEFLQLFENGLENKNMLKELELLHIKCALKARTRTITLARSSRDENLNFQIIGGYDKGCYGIFILTVEKNTKSEEVGLKRGDQILEVNGQSFEHVTNQRAMDILTGTTHLCITVKSNLLAFKELIQLNENNSSSSPRTRNCKRKNYNDIVKLQTISGNNNININNNINNNNDINLSNNNNNNGNSGNGVSANNLNCNNSRLSISSTDNIQSSQDQIDCAMITNAGIGPATTPPPQQQQQQQSQLSTSTVPPPLLLKELTLIKKDLNNICSTSQTSLQSSATGTTATSSTSSSSSGVIVQHKSGFMTLGPKRRIQKALIKMNLLPKNTILDGNNYNDDDCGSSGNISQQTINNQHSNYTTQSIGGGGSSNGSCSTSGVSSLYQSHSNPDLTSVYDDLRSSDYPEHVLKVYKSDQTCKYLLVHKETTAHEVVMLALQEFGIHETSSNFSLCEVSVGEGGMIKQRRLPEQLQNLAERIGLSSRYYLKTNGITETLVPDDMAPELIRESLVHFLQLNANEISIQLTFQDFAIFRQIESTEYVDDLFELNSKYGVPMLKKFAELVNREMFWVVTEVCSEHNIVRRMKIIKQFIKVARHCKECKNFNSMFAIISGLGHVAVSRLRLTWEKLPTKYQKLFNDLQDLMDPSRNMSKYRQLVAAELLGQHPIIPFYPVVKKDLTFIHLGNDTKVEGLINFEKLRMIAKEVRNLTHMCSNPYDFLTLLELRGQPPSSAMVALNQMSVSSGPSNSNNNSQQGQTTVKRRKKSTAAPNPKKMFEEAQMVRRVKAYLNNMKVTTDEDELHRLSLECEPSGGSAPNSVTIRKRHPSPTLSTTSSTSSTSEGKKNGLGGPKFGAASPQAVKKILSLSEQNKTRPHQPRHPGIILPIQGGSGVTLGHHHGLHNQLHHSSISPSPSPGAHRRMGSSSSAGSYTTAHNNFVHGGRAVHERSHSDTPTPLPSVDLSVESSSVTSLSNLPLRKTIQSGSVTSSDSGCVQTDSNSICSDGNSLYHVASSILHNSPSPTLQQRRHSAMHGSSSCNSSRPPFPHAVAVLPPLPPHPAYNMQTQQQQQQQYHSTRTNGQNLMAPPPSRSPRHPPAYSVAAQMARMHRIGRAHSHEGVTSTGGLIPGYFHTEQNCDDDDDEGAQVSAV